MPFDCPGGVVGGSALDTGPTEGIMGSAATATRDRRTVVAAPFRVPDVRGLSRQRVLEALQRSVENHPLTLVVAPAGSGKTTALVQFAGTTSRRSVWYHAASTEGEPDRLLDHLEHTLRQVAGDLPGGWEDADTAAAALASVPDPPQALLLIDDLHELRGFPAEAALERFVSSAPDWLRILAATRHPPGFNHPALRISENLTVIGEEVLRWRTWEVERLFRDYYRMRLRPEEAALLTQRTEGWVAGLQLFHLASRHLPLAGRTQLIDGLHTRPGLVRDYLTHNVLAGLTTTLRSFLIDTCVLGRLDGPLCDRLRDRDDSSALLAELYDKRLFLVTRQDGLGYRYHEVLRAYLEVSLIERDGTMAARARFQRAGKLLEADGAAADALHAYTRAEAWQEVGRLLGTDGPALARNGRIVLANLPPALVQADPWLRLSQARALLGDGRLRAALQAYRDAELAFGDLPGGRTCRDERSSLQPWLEVHEQPPRGLTDILRAAVRRDPRRHARSAIATATPAGLLTGAVALLLAGSIDDARRVAREAGAHPDAEVFTIAAARGLEHVARLAGGAGDQATDLPWTAETFEHLGTTWLARLARTLADCQTIDGLDDIAVMWEVLDSEDDPWGPPLLRLIAGIASVVHAQPRPEWLERAAADFHRLGAGSLEAWARAWGALARARRDEPEPVADAEQARSLARHVQVPGAEAIAELAIASTTDTHAGDAMERAVALARELGLALPDHRPARPVPKIVVLEAPPTSRVSCFDGLELTFAGRNVDLSALKPQGRTVLALLALHAGAPVHRDELIQALWPRTDPVLARRRLPVLISTVRRHLEPDAEPGTWTSLVRRGEAYVLQVPPGTYVDVLALEEAAALARRARTDRDTELEMVGHRAVMEAYRGELLPEVGDAEWVIADREYYRIQVVRAAQALSSWQLDNGDALACIGTVRAGLRVDRYCSPLWDLLTDANRQLGDVAAAARVEEEYAAVLEELGIRT